MGIKGLFPFIREFAPKAIKESQLKSYAGRTLAIDASGWMYQFLAAVRTGTAAENLQNAEGQATSHIQGFLNRSIRMLEAGVLPIFVFDGKPPAMKAEVNKARREARAAAADELAEAIQEEADAEQVYKAASRSTLVTRENSAAAKQLLRAMGLPVVEAPGEAEATCAQLCKLGRVYASVTEDMDVLTFGSPKQIKNLFDVEGSRAGKGPRPAFEVELSAVLDGLSCSMNRFIEFSILSGCDYLPHLPRIGSKTAFKMLETEQSLEGVVAAIKAGKAPRGVTVPDEWDWRGAKALFLDAADVSLPMPADQGCEAKALDTSASPPDYDAVRTFLIDGNQFSSSRVDAALARMRKACSGGSGAPAARQKQLDSFFKPSGASTSQVSQLSAPEKRPAEAEDLPLPSPAAAKRRKLDGGPASAGTVEAADPLAAASVPLAMSFAPTVGDTDGGGATWNCERCTFANDDLLPYCELCETPRPGQAASIATSSSTASAAASHTSASAAGTAQSAAPALQPQGSFARLRPLGASEQAPSVIDLDE